jgi:hypothetical protein
MNQNFVTHFLSLESLTKIAKIWKGKKTQVKLTKFKKEYCFVTNKQLLV